MIYFIGNNVDYINIQSSTIEDLIDYFSDKDEIGFDTETTGFDPYIDRILSYQLGDVRNQFVVDNSQYPIELVQDLLMSRCLLIHNAKFDLKFLYHRGIYPKRVWDTYLGECVIHKGDRSVRKSLEVTILRYTNNQQQLDKTIRGKIFREGFSERVIRYCAEDVEYLLFIKDRQTARMKMFDLVKSMNLENEFVKVLTYIEYSGINLNINLWRKKVEQDKTYYEKSLCDLNNWILDNNLVDFIDTQLDLFDTNKRTTISWSSPLQVAELFHKLGIDTKVVDEKTGALKDSVDAKVLEKQVEKSTIIPIYLEYKRYEKVLSTYGESVVGKINPITQRIHTQFTQILDTGRLSSGGKLGDKETINLQNIPRLPDKEVRIPGKIYERECFTPEEGNILVDADYSGQEQVVFANWTQDPDILKFYKDDLGDMHSYIASKIYLHLRDVPLKTIKNDFKRERQIAKSAGFAINYGGDGNTIADNLNIPKEEGEKIYTAYFEAFPGVKEYFNKCIRQAVKDGYILFNNISRSKSFLSFFDKYKDLENKVSGPGFWEKYREEKTKETLLYRRELKPLVSKYFKLRGNISRMALNYPIQGSSAEITKVACILIFNKLITENLIGTVRFSNVIHDEILLECPKDMGSMMKNIVEECMEKAGSFYCKIVPLRAEAQVCKFWDH